jgi:hypothetical protein
LTIDLIIEARLAKPSGGLRRLSGGPAASIPGTMQGRPFFWNKLPAVALFYC